MPPVYPPGSHLSGTSAAMRGVDGPSTISGTVLLWLRLVGGGRHSFCEAYAHLVGQAETSLERFHHCTEIELLTYVDGEFLEFGKKLFHLTSACEIQGQRRTKKRTGKKSLFSTITAYKPITLLLEKLGYDGVWSRAEWSSSGP
ncbi:hypothetical protein Tco_0596393 [Tanacetum coccineum]